MRLRNSLFILTFACLALTFEGPITYLQPSVLAQSNARLRPPDNLACDDNHLTSFTGRVIAYRRGTRSITLRMRTDEDTTEQFTIRLSPKADPMKWFLMESEPFKASDWKKIEVSRNRLRQRVRATVWVCDDGSNPVVDWRRVEKDTKYVL